MYLAGDAPLPAEYGFLPLDELLPRARRTTSASASCSPSTARTSAGSGRDPAILERAPARRRRRPPPRQHALRRDQPGRRRRLLDRRDRPRPALRELGVALTPEIAEALYVGLVTDTGRFQYSNTTPKALRLAAELVEAGADVHGIFRQRLRDGAVREAEAARARARPRAGCTRAGRLVVSYLAARRLRRGRRRGAVLGGDHRLPAPGEGARAGRADPRAADATAGRRTASRCARASDEVDVSAIARKAGGGGHRQAAGFSSELLDRARSSSSSAASSSPRPAARAADAAAGRVGPSAIVLARQAGRARRRSRSSPSCAAARGARTGHAGTLDPFATGLLVLLSGAATRLAPCFVGLDKRYVTDVDLTSTTTTGDPEGEVVERHDPPGGDELDARLEAPPRRGRAAGPGRLGGEDRRRARLPARAARASRSRCRSAARRSTRSTSSRVRGDERRARRCTSARARTCARSPRRSAATAGRCGGRRSGPFAVDEADAGAARAGGRGARPAAGGGASRRGARAQVSREARARSSTARAAEAREGRAHARRARAAAARGRDRHVRRRPPRPSGGRAGGGRGRAAADRASRSIRTRARCSATSVALLATLERRLELLAELGVEETLVVEFTPELAALAPEEFARLVPRGDRRRGRRRRRGVPLRPQAAAATSRCSSGSGFETRVVAARRGRLVDADPPARRRGRRPRVPPRCSGGRPRSRASSSRAMRAAARSASRPRTSASSRRCSSRVRHLRRRRRSATGRRSRSASTRTTAAPSGGSRRSCSTSRATSTASGSSSSSGSASATRPCSRARPS